MYMRKNWWVLLVDDEPDVLSVTKMALKGIDIWGVPLGVKTASSMKEAKTLLKDTAHPDIAVAIIDVVMETDEAGLELCGHIREDMKNKVTQLIVRTGQAGKAPERDVVDRYDISAYITKVEATQDRLYTLMKSCVRQYAWARAYDGWRMHHNALIAAGRKRADLVKMQTMLMRRPTLDRDGNPLPGHEGHLCYFVDDEVIGIGAFENREEASRVRSELATLPAVSFGDTGDSYRRRGNEMLISVPGSADGKAPPIDGLARMSMDPLPDFLTSAWFDHVYAFRNLWIMADR